MIGRSIARLVQYGVQSGLLPADERTYATNLLLDALHLDSYEQDAEPAEEGEVDLEATLAELLDFAEQQGIIEGGVTERDLFDTRLMNCLAPRPHEVIRTFWSEYDKSPRDATDWFYKLSQDSDYIRRYRVRRDRRWRAPTEYGELDITINLSKPEKDPRAIAAAGTAKSATYPRCQLCVENEGYAGRMDHPARETHRIIPIELAGGRWGFQYSPYTYYNEHCIALNSEHVPMRIDHAAFVKLFDFVKLFPHYFIGSNADLPIVGGSILSHDHFQGGRFEFAMERAPIERERKIPGFEDVTAGVVRWPMSVIRLRSKDEGRVIALADHVLEKWRGYTDEDAFIFAETDGEPHNTITPVARRRGDEFELDLVLRNNITTPERPYGVFHPPEELHHIKKENIGLIEVMGLAVLPARLAREMELVASGLLEGRDLAADPETAKHAEWATRIATEHPELDAGNVEGILQAEIGKSFAKVLEAAGVFKRDEAGQKAFDRFLDTL